MQYNIYQIPGISPLQTALTGKNARNILIVFRSEDSETYTSLLEKIMYSVGLNLHQDCVLFSVGEEDYGTLAAIRAQQPIDKVIVFGVDKKHLGLQARIPQNSPFILWETELLFTHPLSDLVKDQKKKRALWNALKQMFIQDEKA